ncbi:hypothetical protein ACJRO7_022417 [Eucalyptus globulus]|uniref:Uncharacterized protein n=1 Tax=Eucalyptus globulus TaxID=34317 RepID=A0ABD3JYZ6_EUCGL
MAASSSSPSSSPSSRSRTLLSKLLQVSVLILLLVNSCSTARHLGMANQASPRVALNWDQPRRRVFNFFPKRSTVPPSGPPKRQRRNRLGAPGLRGIIGMEGA